MEGNYRTDIFSRKDDPLRFTLMLTNTDGTDQPIPAGAAFPAPAESGKPVLLPAGIRLTLGVSPPNPSPPLRPEEAYTPSPYADEGWETSPLRGAVQSAPAPASGPASGGTPILSPMQTAPVFQGNLRDYFDITRPGKYRLSVEFMIPGKLEGKTNPAVFILPY